MLQGLDRIVGKVVTAVEVMSPAWDLVLTLGNKLYLHVFCDQSQNEVSSEDYVLFAEGRTFIVGPKGKVAEETSR